MFFLGFFADVVGIFPGLHLVVLKQRCHVSLVEVCAAVMHFIFSWRLLLAKDHSNTTSLLRPWVFEKHNACQTSIECIEITFRFYFLPPQSLPTSVVFVMPGIICFSAASVQVSRRFWAWGRLLMSARLCSSERNMMGSTYSSPILCVACHHWRVAAGWVCRSLTSSHWQAAYLRRCSIHFTVSALWKPMQALTEEKRPILSAFCCATAQYHQTHIRVLWSEGKRKNQFKKTSGEITGPPPSLDWR